MLVEGSTKFESSEGFGVNKLVVGDLPAENIWIGFWTKERAFNVVSIGKSNFSAKAEAALEVAYGKVQTDLGVWE